MTKNAPRVRVWASLVEGWDPVAFQEAREAAGLTFDALADKLDLSRSTVRAWSEHARPRTKKLSKIAKALGVPQSALLTKKGA